MKTTDLCFGDALEALKRGERIARTGWNGKGMHLWLDEDPVVGDGIAGDPCIVMLTAHGTHQPGWLASQADMLAEDWMIID